MSTMYIAILGILLLLAIFDLVVGVSNDAANFLNSAVGCKAATRSIIVAVAAVGVVVGASFSSGMMEIARSGVFTPGMFTFGDVMILFLAVMLTDVILLDMFNTLGLPTSTTVSLICELLGAAIAVALFTMARGGEDVSQRLSDYINTDKVMEMIGGIFCSVAVAFVCGASVMWFSRLLFSFRYQRTYRYAGAAWCALALTAITYFAIFKGLKSSTLISKADMAWLNAHTGMATALAFACWLVISYILQHTFKVNTLRLTVLAGTGALALAFAGNDLVNFIGVFMAAHASFETASTFAAQGGDISSLTMESLSAPVQVNMLWLTGAGIIMVLALAFSRKARTVTETEVKLARNTSGGRERFGSCLPARVLVRGSLNAARLITRITPAPIARFVGNRFKPLEEEEQTDDAAFDLVRGSVNLTVAALLISLATSMKLPLSTTYVTFMVGMGSSLADRAWGRDSAVYRITGVLTVIGGWFLTGIVATAAALIIASVMMYGGVAGIVLMVILAALVLAKSAMMHRQKGSHEPHILDLGKDSTMRDIGIRSADRLGRLIGIYRATIQALLNEARPALKRLRRKSRSALRELRDLKEDEVLPSLHGLSPALAPQGQILLRLHESSIRIAESLLLIVKASYNHIDNNHAGLTEAQVQDLLDMSGKVAGFFPGLCQMLQSDNYSNMESVMQQAGDLGEEFADCITRHLMREADDETGMRNSVLFLNLLNETRAMVRQSFSLIKEQRELFES